MEAINQAERKAAITKFTIFLALSAVLFIIPFLFYSLIPKGGGNAPQPTSVIEDNVPADNPSALADVQQRIAQLAARMEKVNITFLVDATEGMEKHLPAVAQAIGAIEQQYQAEIEAACYRDAAEGTWLYMTNQMVGDAPVTWVQSLDTESKFDQDEPEALYYGLKRTLESRHLNSNETNLLILVGDAGNHSQEPATDVSPSDIVQLMQAKGCHFAAFQARNPSSSSTYADFSSQVMDDILTPIKTSAGNALQEKDSLDSYGIYYKLTGDTYYTLYATNPAQSLPDDVLTEKISQFVAQVLIPKQHLATINALAKGESATFSPDLADYLRQNQFSDEEVTLLTNR
ncbi:MAG: hypothetical protein AAF944_08480 [Bacteroidota bacterium]